MSFGAGLPPALALLLVSPFLQAAQNPKPEFGLLLLTVAGTRDLKEVAATLRKTYPVEQAPGTDTGALQKSVERLKERKVKKIIAVPFYISNHATAMDQVRYLLGIRKEPSRAFLSEPHARLGGPLIKRVRSTMPVVLAPALDDHPVAVEILILLAKELSRDPSRENLLLVASAGPGDEKNSQWLGTLQAVAEAARRKAGFRSARVYTLPENVTQAQRDKARKGLRELAKSLKREAGVIVIAWMETQSPSFASIPKILDGLFIKTSTRPPLSHPKIAQWARESALKAAPLPDMRTFKDAGLPLPPAPPGGKT